MHREFAFFSEFCTAISIVSQFWKICSYKYVLHHRPTSVDPIKGRRCASLVRRCPRQTWHLLSHQIKMCTSFSTAGGSDGQWIVQSSSLFCCLTPRLLLLVVHAFPCRVLCTIVFTLWRDPASRNCHFFLVAGSKMNLWFRSLYFLLLFPI
jgi:hypothetical protein